MSKQFFDNEETTTCKGDTRKKNKRDKTYGSRCRPGVLDPWTFQSVPVRLEPVTNGSLSLFTKLDLQVLIVAEWEHRSCKPILFQVWFEFNWSSRKQLFVSMILEQILVLPCARWFLFKPGEQHQHQKTFEKQYFLVVDSFCTMQVLAAKIILMLQLGTVFHLLPIGWTSL